MGRTNQETIALAEEKVKKGDYRRARNLIRGLKKESALSAADREAKKRILAATGIDSFVVAVIAITFLIWLYLLIKYVF